MILKARAAINALSSAQVQAQDSSDCVIHLSDNTGIAAAGIFEIMQAGCGFVPQPDLNIRDGEWYFHLPSYKSVNFCVRRCPNPRCEKPRLVENKGGEFGRILGALVCPFCSTCLCCTETVASETARKRHRRCLVHQKCYTCHHVTACRDCIAAAPPVSEVTTGGRAAAASSETTPLQLSATYGRRMTQAGSTVPDLDGKVRKQQNLEQPDLEQASNSKKWKKCTGASSQAENFRLVAAAVAYNPDSQPGVPRDPLIRSDGIAMLLSAAAPRH